MITRKEIVAKYKIAAKKVKQLESKKYEYKTNRACEPFGLVQNMNIDDVVRAGASVHDGDANITARIEQYGVRPDDLKNCSARKFLGLPLIHGIMILSFELRRFMIRRILRSISL